MSDSGTQYYDTPSPRLNGTALVCFGCGRQYARQYDLERHLMPKIKCPKHDCTKSFRFDKKTEFMKHINTRHSGLFDVIECDEYFQRLKSVTKPMKGVCTEGITSAPRTPSTIQTSSPREHPVVMASNESIMPAPAYRSLQHPDGLDVFGSTMSAFDLASLQTGMNSTALVDVSYHLYNDPSFYNSCKTSGI